MQINLKVIGADKVLSNFTDKINKLRQAQRDGVKTVAIRLRDEATVLSKGGHPEHPNVQSGRLSNSFRYQMVESGKAIAYVGSDVDYAISVEFGHMSRSWGSDMWHWVPAYPFFMPAIVNVFDSGEAQAIFEKVFQNALR